MICMYTRRHLSTHTRTLRTAISLRLSGQLTGSPVRLINLCAASAVLLCAYMHST